MKNNIAAKTPRHEGLNYRSDEFVTNLPPVPAESQRRDLTTRTYSVRIDTVNEKERTVDAVIATEARVLVFDWNRWEIIEEILLMKGCRIPADGQIPMHDTHDRSTVQKQFGSTRNLRIEGDKLVGTNCFSTSKETEHAWTLTREKHLRDNSIGYKVYNPVMISAGEKAVVEGREFQASANYDLRISTDWEPKENSICSIGADSAAKNRSDNKNNINIRKDSKMNKFKEWLTARGLDFDKLNETTRAALQKDFEDEQKRTADANKKPKEKTGDSADDGGQRTAVNTPGKQLTEEDIKRATADGIAAERKRIADITSLGGEDVKAETINRCITDGLSLDAARGEILKDVREYRSSNVKNVPAGIAGGNMTAGRELIEDALVLRAGYEDVLLKDKANGEKRAEAAGKLRDVSLEQVCRMALQIENRAIPFGREDCIRAAFSTHSLAIILGNVANKALLRGYELLPGTWQKWCTIGQAADFKTMTRVRLSQNSTLQQVGSGGKIQSGSTEEEYEQFSIATYAELLPFTRTQIINDDLDALTRVPQGMGAAAKALIGDLVYTHLLANGTMQDGTALFASDHGNLNTSKALSAENLKLAITAFGKQKNKAGRNINTPVRFLIVPPDLQWLAKELLKSSTIVIAGAGDTERGSLNVLGGENIEVVNEARLSNTSFSNYSTSTWFLAGDKNLVDTIEVAFLRGNQNPTLEQVPMASDVLGIQYRIYHDAGCKALDYRGLQKNTA